MNYATEGFDREGHPMVYGRGGWRRVTGDNPNCDGAGPHTPGPVKRYPLAASSAVILCHACWQHENAWRAELKYADMPVHDWASGEVYGESQS